MDVRLTEETAILLHICSTRVIIILFIFLIDVIFVLPIFYFGTLSLFSGTAMYDTVLY
jgi:hypothetical protein